MNLLDRLLLVLYSLSIAVIALIFILLPFNILPINYMDSIIAFISKDYLSALTALLILIVSIKLFLSCFSLDGLSTKKAVKKGTDWGQVNISYNTIEQLAQAAAKRVSGVKDIKIRVNEAENQIIIHVVTTLMNDANIPSTTQELQKVIKEHVESLSGVTVREVKVTVDELNNNTSKRRVD